jgi:uncharacterized membrane protein
VGVGCLLRFHELGAESLWTDEVATLQFARMPIDQLWRPQGDADLSPPLWYSLQKIWLLFGDSEQAIRSLSAIAGSLGVLLVYFLGRSASRESVGLLAASFAATSVALVYFSQEARAYSLLFSAGAAVLWALFYLLSDIQRSTLPFRRADRCGSALYSCLAWAAYILASIVALYSHNTAALLIAWCNISALILWNLNGRDRVFVTAWVIANSAIGLAYCWWLPIALSQLGHPELLEATGKRFTSAAALTKAAVQAFGFRRSPVPDELGTCIILGLAALGSWRMRADNPAILLLTGTVIFVLGLTALVSFWSPILNARTLIWLLAPLTVLVAIGVASLPKFWSMVVASAVIALNLTGLREYYSDVIRPQWREVAGLLAADVTGPRIIVVHPQDGVLPLNHYLEGYKADQKFEILTLNLAASSSELLVRRPMGQPPLPVSDLLRQHPIWLLVGDQAYLREVSSQFQEVGLLEPALDFEGIALFKAVGATPPSQ